MKRALGLLLCACGPAVDVYVESASRGDTSSTGANDTSNDSNSDAGEGSFTTTMSADGTSSSTTGDDERDDDGNFLVPFDISCFTHCPPVDCSTWDQDCGDGEKCMPWANDGGGLWNALRCSVVEREPAPVGAACLAEGAGVSGIDDCEAGAMCWGVDADTGEGECVAFCTGTPEAPVCADGLTCVTMFDDVLNVCLPQCDPLVPSCAVDEACMYSGNEVAFACLPVPPFLAGEYGDPCSGGLVSCDTGLLCVGLELVPGCEMSSCCSVLGDVDAPPVCPDASQTCIPFEDESSNLCVCGVPQ